jgi:hypothetical protein
MPRFKIVHNAPVWERTVVWVDVPEDKAELIQPGSDAYDHDFVDSLLTEAILKDEACIEVTGQIESMDSDTEVTHA